VHDTPENDPSEVPAGVGPVEAAHVDPVRVSTSGKYR
jgi:hypothetical protein